MKTFQKKFSRSDSHFCGMKHGMFKAIISTYFEVLIGIYPTVAFSVAHENTVRKTVLMFWTVLTHKNQKLMQKKTKVGLK